MLIGNNIALVVYGFFMGDVLMQESPVAFFRSQYKSCWMKRKQAPSQKKKRSI